MDREQRAGRPAALARPPAAGAPGLLPEGRRRVALEAISPEVDGGRFAVKRVVGEPLDVEVDLVCDGHDALAGVLRLRREGEATWLEEAPLRPLGNDRWGARVHPPTLGRYRYALQAWVDPFATWRRDLARRAEAGQDVAVELRVGAELLARHAAVARGELDADLLRAWAATLADRDAAPEARLRLALDERVAQTVARHPERRFASESAELPLEVDRERAAFSAWYELFPRSAGPPGRHGTLADVEARLDEVAAMGFDVLYLPPIHPIGRAARKGPDNSERAGPGDPGSPWAIGGPEGGHEAIHPELGTLEDLRRLIAGAAARGIELALDLAFQCSPDHPWVREHPEWFERRPDGSIRYAENPPKRYQDIYPLDFEGEAWESLWRALLDVVLHWTAQGVRIFRVDNPHTKPLPFWEWLIAEVRRAHPDALFLAEAFTRPKLMARLAKLGFSQSYTYFTWRNTRDELTEYLTELTRPPTSDFFRPNLWPNTPDILPEALQVGGRPAFVARLVLAATLGASYGVYGPAFELCEGRAVRPGSEEYLASEKYQLRAWPREEGLRPLIARVNALRREHAALQSNRTLRFHPTDNEALLCYSKRGPDGEALVMVVNLDPHHAQAGWVRVPLAELGADPSAPTQAHDLLGGARVLWSGERQFVRLEPWELPAHVFLLRRRVRTERDFDYFL